MLMAVYGNYCRKQGGPPAVGRTPRRQCHRRLAAFDVERLPAGEELAELRIAIAERAVRFFDRVRHVDRSCGAGVGLGRHGESRKSRGKKNARTAEKSISGPQDIRPLSVAEVPPPVPSPGAFSASR